jgi:hypothetical protein
MALAWTLPNPVSGGMWLENPSRSGGVASNGQEQNIISLSMRQRAQWTIPIRRPAEIKAARELFGLAQGKAVGILMPIFEPKFSRTATLSASAAIRATVVSVTLTAGPAPEAGRHFGIGHRAYLITDVDGTGAGTYTLNCLPPLRAAASSGATVLFDEAVVEMNFTTDENPVMLDVMRYAPQLDLSFVEAW